MHDDERDTVTTAGEGQAAAPEVIAMINDVTAPLTGSDYFRTLVERLVAQLDLDKAIVTECLHYPAYHVRTLAFWRHSGFGENFEFDVRGTPCEDVVDGGEFCFWPERVGECFPEFVDPDDPVESYIGIPIYAPSDGRTVGHIAVFDAEPMKPDSLTESMFRIIASRAGGEIERLQAERARRDSEARARQHLSELAHVTRLGSMGELATALAHEVNQPLTAIITYTQTLLKMLEQDRLDAADLRQGLERSLASAEHARDVVGKLRQFIRRGEANLRAVPAARLIRDCQVLLETEARHHRVDLKLRIEDDLPTVRVDGVLVQQVLFNLVKNGIESVDDSEGKQRELVVAAELQDDEVVVRVSDSGRGVDEDLRERLFEPFVSSRKNGLGIGLSLCKSVIERHRGRIWIDDDRSPGATFCFSLPVHRVDEGESPTVGSGADRRAD